MRDHLIHQPGARQNPETHLASSEVGRMFEQPPSLRTVLCTCEHPSTEVSWAKHERSPLLREGCVPSQMVYLTERGLWACLNPLRTGRGGLCICVNTILAREAGSICQQPPWRQSCMAHARKHPSLIERGWFLCVNTLPCQGGVVHMRTFSPWRALGACANTIPQ